jgi:hypothetical protein
MAKDNSNVVRGQKNDPLKRDSKKNANKVIWEFPFRKQNFILLALGLGVIILGYLLMATGITDEPAIPEGKWNNPMAVIVAPLLLFIGYCILIPFAIVKYFGNSKSKNEAKYEGPIS